jgi:hypothetical protein
LNHCICSFLAKRLLTTRSMMGMVVIPSTTTAGQVTQVFGAAGRPAGDAPEHSAVMIDNRSRLTARSCASRALTAVKTSGNGHVGPAIDDPPRGRYPKGSAAKCGLPW